MHLCIVTPSEPATTETFIRAHLEQLPFDIIPLYVSGAYSSCNKTGLYAVSCGQSGGRWLNILPRFLEFRLRNHLYPNPSESEVVADFLKQNKIDVVLAEYGTASASVTPACQMAGVPLVAHFHGYDASRYDVI